MFAFAFLIALTAPFAACGVPFGAFLLTARAFAPERPIPRVFVLAVIAVATTARGDGRFGGRRLQDVTGISCPDAISGTPVSGRGGVAMHHVPAMPGAPMMRTPGETNAPRFTALAGDTS